MPIEVPYLPIINNPEISKNILSINEQFILNKANTIDQDLLFNDEFNREGNNYRKFNNSVFDKSTSSPKKFTNKIQFRTKFSSKINRQDEHDCEYAYNENEILSYNKNNSTSNLIKIKINFAKLFRSFLNNRNN